MSGGRRMAGAGGMRRGLRARLGGSATAAPVATLLSTMQDAGSPTVAWCFEESGISGASWADQTGNVTLAEVGTTSTTTWQSVAGVHVNDGSANCWENNAVAGDGRLQAGDHPHVWIVGEMDNADNVTSIFFEADDNGTAGEGVAAFHAGGLGQGAVRARLDNPFTAQAQYNWDAPTVGPMFLEMRVTDAGASSVVQFWLNGVQQATTFGGSAGDGLLNTLTYLRLGGLYGTEYLVGKLAAAVAFRSDPGATVRNAAKTYLASKYSLTITAG